MTKRLALTVGIDRYGNGADLQGCVADAMAWGEALRPRGFEVTELFNGAATKAGIGEHIRRVLDRCEFGDRFVLVYSGHGTWVPDLDGDELDRRDEALCPVDLWTNGPLIDDELFELLSARAYGVRVAVISDSCHSGSVNRLAAPIADEYRRVRFLPPAAFLPRDQVEKAAGLERIVKGRPRPAGLLLSGCQDFEVSYEAVIDGQVRGIMSYTALAALRENPPTYRDWHRMIRSALPSQDFPQSPQLQASSTQKRWPVLA